MNLVVDQVPTRKPESPTLRLHGGHDAEDSGAHRSQLADGILAAKLSISPNAMKRRKTNL